MFVSMIQYGYGVKSNRRGCAARKYVAKERDGEDTGGKRGEGMKSKINNSWLPPPTTSSSSTRGASERGKRARNSCRQGSQWLPSPKLVQKPNLTYLTARTLLSAFQRLHLVFCIRAWRRTNKKENNPIKRIHSTLITSWSKFSHLRRFLKLTDTHCHKLPRLRAAVTTPPPPPSVTLTLVTHKHSASHMAHVARPTPQNLD